VQWEQTKKKQSIYKLIMVGLTMDKKYLYEKINQRVDLMIEKGLLQEVKELLRRGYKTNLKSMQSLGYFHFANYLEGKYDWKTAVTTLKRDTRRFAKRQLTWFRSDNRILWYERKPNNTEINPILDNICYTIEGY
jgi:tRNA dimethylallyltransferase